MKTLLAACTDFGTVYAFLPVLDKFKGRQDWHTVILADAGTPAHSVFIENGWNPRGGEPVQILAEENPDFLLTGIAEDDHEVGKEALAIAIRTGVKSGILIESWPHKWLSLYGLRDVPLYKNAGIIFVPDRLSFNELVIRGFVPERVAVTGSPLHDMARAHMKERVAYRNEIRGKYGIPLNAVVVLFVTTVDLDDEANNSPIHPEWLGCKEEDVVREYLEAMVEVEQSEGAVPVRGLIRQKPSHGTRRLKELITQFGGEVPLDTDDHRMGLPTLLSADVVVGVATLAVQNAALMGIPALYCLPDLCKPDPMVTDALRVTIPMYGKGDLRRLIRGIGKDPLRVVKELKREMCPVTLPEDATGNVIREIVAFNQ